MIPAFPKILQLGDKNLSTLFDGEQVEITEKLDGSQFSFGKIGGQLFARSKGQMVVDTEGWRLPKLFANIEPLLRDFDRIGCNTDIVLSGEYLGDRKQNILTYENIPPRNFALFAFGQKTGSAWNYSSPFSYDALYWQSLLGFGLVGALDVGTIKPDMDYFNRLLEQTSGLGGPKIEGFVIKNYSQSMMIGGMYVPIMAAKYVSEAFKEKHKREWDPGLGIVDQIVLQYAGEARWNKAIQKMREAGTLTDSVKDIGPLMGVLNKDFHEEEKEAIKDLLFKHFWKDIARRCSNGFPEWYKRKLVENSIKET